jgi:prohibitin 2
VFWIIVMFLLAVMGGIGYVVGRGLPLADGRGYGGVSAGFKSLVKWGSAVTAAVLMVIATFFSSVHTLNSGHVGVVRSFGQIDGQIDSGVQFTLPWQTVNDANVQIQSYTTRLTAFSQETQNVDATVTVNYHVSPNAIQNLYASVGTNYFDVLVAPRLAQIFKDTTVKYTATDIAPNRETIRTEVRDSLAEALQPYSIDVADVLIRNISFSKQFTQSIEQKQIQTQDSLRAQQKVAQARYEAEQTVATARGNAQSVLVAAEAQARANHVLTHSLTPLLVRYQAIQKFNPNVQVALLPSGQGSLIDPSSFLRGKVGR